MDELRRRWPLMAAGVVAVVVVAGLVLLLAGGDNDEPTVSGPAVSSPAPRPQRTVTQPPTQTTGGRPSDKDAGAIQRTVTDLVSTNERGDSAGLCRIVGQQASGSGFDALHTCANSAGVDVSILPISDELSIDRIRVKRSRATASLASGVTISLRRAGAGWQVTGATR
jgi:hypothetical protein